MVLLAIGAGSKYTTSAPRFGGNFDQFLFALAVLAGVIVVVFCVLQVTAKRRRK